MTDKYLVTVRAKDWSIIVEADSLEDALDKAIEDLDCDGAVYDYVEDPYLLPEDYERPSN